MNAKSLILCLIIVNLALANDNLLGGGAIIHYAMQ